MNLGRSLVLALNWLHAITSLFLSKAAPTLVLPLAELVQERTDFMKMKATHDLDTGEEGQALLPPSPRPSSMELPGSVEHGAVPDFVLETLRGAGPSQPSSWITTQGTPN